MGVLETLEGTLSTYCENGIGIFSTEPINTISNIAILISAYFSYQLIRAHNIKNPTVRVLPVVVAFIGIGSILRHGAPSILTSFADTLPIIVFAVISFYFLLDKILPNKRLVWGTVSAVLLVESPFLFGILPTFNRFIVYSIVLIFGLFVFFDLARKYKKVLSQLVIISLLFTTSFFFRSIDLAICPAFPIGTHFLWHALNAVVFYLMARLIIEIETKKKLNLFL